MSLFHCLLLMGHLHRMGTGNDDDMPGPSGYQDPVVPDENMPYDDPGDDSPNLGGTGGGPFGPGPGPPGNQGGSDPDLPSGEIEFHYGPGGNPPPHYPGGGAAVPVPDDSDSSIELIPDGAYGPSPDDDHPPYPMEVHTEPPPPGGPPDAPGAQQPFANPDQIMQPPPHVPQATPQPIVPLPKHPHFPLPGVMRPPSPRNVPLTRSSGLHPDDTGPKAKLRFPSVGMKIPPPMKIAPTPVPIQPVSVPKFRAPATPVVTLPGQGVKDKGFPADPDLEPENEPGSSSNDPPAVPGLPVTEGEFPIIHETPAPSDQAPIPETGSDSDSAATVDYREHQSSLLTLVEGDEDILIELPSDFKVPNLVPLDGDGFASWLTRQDKVKAGTVTPEMQRRYAKEIRLAKLDEFKSYLDNGALRLADKRKLSRDINFLTGRWVLTVKVDKNGFFSKFKARWVCRGFQDKHAWEQQTDSPTATRYGFRLVAQCAANNYWDLFHLDLKTAFLRGNTTTPNRAVSSFSCRTTSVCLPGW